MIIGVTGGIGSGKSTVLRSIARRSYPVYDCDAEAKRLILEDSEVRRQMVELFGEEVYRDGVYQTQLVAEQVFADKSKLARLNAIVHPAVERDIRRWAEGSSHQSDVRFVESAILFEAGLDELCDKIVVVEAPEEVRIERTIARDYHGEATPANIKKVRARIRAQKTSADVAPRRPILTVLNDGKSVLSSIIDLICDFATR